jgi:hypothetical protein
MRQDASWPELTYRLIEHYKWEPKGLSGTIAEFYARLRKREVPLNFLFNILLRCSSPKTISAIISEFSCGNLLSKEKSFRLEYPYSTKIVQPDVVLESDDERIFIEVKIGAKTSLDQVQKYLLLHAEMDLLFGPKRPFLFFLTDADLIKSWHPSKEATPFANSEELLKYASECPTSPTLLARMRRKEIRDRVEEVKSLVSCGATTWKALGDRLVALTSGLKADEVEFRLIGDFISDLKRRGLIAATDE